MTARATDAIAALGAAAAIALGAAGCGAGGGGGGGGDAVVIGSKQFTESVILGELATQLLTDRGVEARHARALGATRIVWNALRAGEIDAYPEYTGTLRQEILRGAAAATDAELAAALAAEGVVIVGALGFDNTYAIGMREDTAARLGVRTLSDLARHPELTLGLSHEFIDRGDGWVALRDRYRLAPRKVRGLDHDLAYRALADGAIDAADLYSTDAEIRQYGLRVLVDDLGHFPSYQAVMLARADLAARRPAAIAALAELTGRVDRETMIGLNARAEVERVRERQVAGEFAVAALGVGGSGGRDPGRAGRILGRTREHLVLVGLSLLAALIVALPLGIVAARRPRLGQVVLAVVGVLQTVPSLALLVLLIPLLGIGTLPALAALFLYSLLPIVRNTSAGLGGLPPPVRESAEALGLSSWARLVRVELPLASPAILAGVKTAAVLNVGVATLGALIGAGGYGQPILTGVRMDDVALILEGAIPAAALALLVQWLFELVEHLVVPRGLR